MQHAGEPRPLGGRLSLEIGLWVVALNAVFGVMLGAASGYFRRLDGPLMRLSDALMAFPSVLLAIGIAAALGPSVTTVVVALAVVYIPRTARVLRASVLVVRELDYVQAARACGAGDGRILLRHVLPNCMAPLIVQLSFVFAYALLSLRRIGLGARRRPRRSRAFSSPRAGATSARPPGSRPSRARPSR